MKPSTHPSHRTRHRVAAILLTVTAGVFSATVMAQSQRITIDSHIDIPLDYATSATDPGINGPLQVDLVKMRRGGLDAGFFIVYVGQGERSEAGYRAARADALTKFSAIHRVANWLYPDQIELAFNADDVRNIHARGKLVALIGIENGYVIGRDLGLIRDYYNLGGRYMTLAHNGHNDLADSAQPRPGEAAAEHGGLSALGRAAVATMNDVGMLVDVSHVSVQAARQAIALSRAPVIASHSAVSAINNHPRNMDDVTMRALAAKGGVIQVVAFDSYVQEVPAAKVKALAELRARYGVSNPADMAKLSAEKRSEFDREQAKIDDRWPRATVAQFVDHIDYAVKLIGIDHVGIASDFEGGGGVTGWQNAAETANVTAELVRRGYSDADIDKLWGGNLLGVLAAAQALAGN
ncbi:MAG: membrane dipeptidase [Gammaproteobacteria bacterium]|nr:membrane dipeptidase [Gammaproteobacteria bacterium]